MSDDQALTETPQGLSQLERVVDIFVAPTATFRDILRSTSWWLPFVLMSVAVLGISFTIEHKVGWEQVVETQIHMNPAQQAQMAELTPEVQAQQMHRMVLGYRYASYAYPVLMLAGSALAALVLWASFNFGLGARTTYGQMFCLWMYCALPRLLAAAITVLMLLFGGSPESFNLKEPIGTNPAYYMPDAWPWLRAALGFFDVIGIWVLVLLILGGAIVAKVKVGHAAVVILGWWLLILAISVAAAAAFG